MEEKKLEDMTIDETFAQIDALLSYMEEKDISLEDSFRCYQQGITALKSVNDKIEAVEKQVKLLNADGELEPFETAEE